ncbi:MAG: hypothetical protein GY796_36220 [Chloroflexi bacterium]|nr:hypothetical protein [Chloroflexota bacterium]
MKLEQTKKLIHGKINHKDPLGCLILVLKSAIELLALPDNVFCWSSWEDNEEATNEIMALIDIIKDGNLPDIDNVSVLFSPTGPIQEISLSSGWGKIFLKVAKKYDEVKKLLW